MTEERQENRDLTLERDASLKKEMEPHTYEIMNRVENEHWWFVGRRAILREFLRDICSRMRPGGVDGASEGEVAARRPRIIDVGCGTGANLDMLSEFGNAVGVDVSDEAVSFCRSKGLEAQKGLAETLPFPADSFDLVTALDVIEHLDDDIEGLSEMNRVLVPGGYALFFVPAFMWLWGVQDDVSNHRIRYTREQITKRVRESGFEIVRATYANLSFFLPILAGRLIMRITGLKPASENNINIRALNGLFGRVFGAERHWLKRRNLSLGVSIVVAARKRQA